MRLPHNDIGGAECAPLSIFAGVMALRERGLVRVGVGFFALSLMLSAFAPTIGLSGWPAWGAQRTLLFISSLILIGALRRPTRVRLITIGAGVLLVTAAIYSTKKLGYDMWLRGTKQNSVFTK